MKIFVSTLLLASLASGRPVTYPRRWLVPRQVANLQTFTGNVGADALPITDSGNPDRPFEVNGATFQNFEAAAARSCDVQFNQCANVANGGGDVEFEQCNQQKADCQQAQANAGGGNTGGNADDGAANDGNANDGNANDGNANDGNANNGAANDGNANDGNANDGNANDGNANDGNANNGNANDGAANDGAATGAAAALDCGGAANAGQGQNNKRQLIVLGGNRGNARSRGRG